MTYGGRSFVCPKFLQVKVLDEICDKGQRVSEWDEEMENGGSEIMLPLRTDDVVAYARVRERAERRAFEREETQPWTGTKCEYMVRTAAAVCLRIVDMAVR